MSKAAARATDTNWSSDCVSTLAPHIHEIRRLLDLDGEWRMSDGVSDTNTHIQLIRRLVNAGAISVVGRYQNGGNTHKKYRWHETAREDLRAYLDNMRALPCGCRAHIPPGRAYPDPWMRCKHCQTAHTQTVIKNSL